MIIRATVQVPSFHYITIFSPAVCIDKSAFVKRSSLVGNDWNAYRRDVEKKTNVKKAVYLETREKIFSSET